MKEKNRNFNVDIYSIYLRIICRTLIIKIGTLMRIILLLTLLNYSIVSYSFGLEPNEKKDFLRFENLLNKDHKSPPSLIVFDDKSFKGKPIIIMDKEGLKIKGVLVCKWSKEYAESIDSRTLRNVKDTRPCSQYPPVFADDDPDSPPSLWIEISNSSNPNYYEATFQGRQVYIDKNSNSDFVFELSKEKQFQLKRPAEQQKYESLLLDSPNLKDYISKLHDCFKNKNELCFVDESKDFVGAYSLFIESVCEYEGFIKPKLYRQIGKYCPELLTSEDLNSGVSDGKKKKDLAARAVFKKEFWRNYQSCFHDENPSKLSGEIYEGSSDQYKNVIFHPNKENYFSCHVNGRKQPDGNFTWDIFLKK